MRSISTNNLNKTLFIILKRNSLKINLIKVKEDLSNLIK